MSLKVIFRMLKLGTNLPLAECLEMEYKILRHMVNRNDFHEGVRALLMSKDGNPKWDPASLEDITDQHVLDQFEPPSDTVKLSLMDI